MSKEQEIRNLIIEQLGLEADKVVDSAHLVSDLHIDSLDRVEMIMVIEEKFGIEIPDSEIEKLQTVGDVIKFIKEKTENQ